MRHLVPRTRATDDGYILVAVLAVMLVLTALAGAASVFMRSALHAARLGTEDDAMSGLTQGALEITAYELFVLKLPPSLANGRRIRLAGATLTPTILDEASKVDINGADPKLLQAVFESIGMDSGVATSLVTRIVARRGNPQGQPGQGAPGQGLQGQGQLGQSPNGNLQGQTSISAQGQQQQPGTTPDGQKKLRGFQSVEELGEFPEVTSADLRAMGPLLTVYNPDGKINIMTASEDVLRAIPGMTPPRVEDILAHRESATDKSSIENLESALGDAKSMTKHDPGPAYTVRLDVTTNRTHSARVVMAASKSNDDPYYILDWRE